MQDMSLCPILQLPKISNRVPVPTIPWRWPSKQPWKSSVTYNIILYLWVRRKPLYPCHGASFKQSASSRDELGMSVSIQIRLHRVTIASVLVGNMCGPISKSLLPNKSTKNEHTPRSLISFIHMKSETAAMQLYKNRGRPRDVLFDLLDTRIEMMLDDKCQMPLSDRTCHVIA